MSKKIISSIDIGTSKISCIMARADSSSLSFDILGYSSVPSKGISKGIIIDVEEATNSISRAIKAAEESSGTKCNNVVANISGSNLESITTSSALTLAKYPREIKKSDAKRIQDIAEDRTVGMDRYIINRIAYNYRVDDGSVMKNPVGMAGRKLEADIHIVTSPINSVESITKSIKNLGVSVDSVMLSSLADSFAVLSDTDRRMGSLVLDIGAGTTDIALIRNDKLIFACVIPIAGEHFTNDLATILNVDLKTAEYLKNNFSNLLETSEDGEIEVSSNNSNDVKKVSLSYVKSIIDARTEELIYYLNRELEISKSIPLIRSSIVITGGAAKTAGLVPKVEKAFQISTRVGSPFSKYIRSENIKVPEFSTAVGLIEGSMFEKKNRENYDSFWDSIKSRFSNIFSKWSN